MYEQIKHYRSVQKVCNKYKSLGCINFDQNYQSKYLKQFESKLKWC
jgi:hypothetical protein